MPNALRTTRQGFIVAQAFLAQGKSVKQAVHGGDTVSISPNSFLNTRLLGVDTPEVSFSLPSETTFPSIGGERWAGFLDDPFAPGLPAFDPRLPDALRAHLLGAVGSGCAPTTFVHAKAAEAELQDLIQADVDDSGGSVAELGLFLAFAHDVIDRYGRLLAFVHRDDPVAQPRPYNEHLLAGGVALPYFIWPNVAPFIREADVPEPGVPIGGAHLDAARNAVATARTAGHLRAARSVAIAAVRTPLSRACYHRHQPSSVGPRPMGH
jgi:hypothetical protein